MSGSKPLPAELREALLSVHRAAKHPLYLQEYLNLTSMAFKEFFGFSIGSDLMSTLLSAHRSAKDDEDYEGLISLALNEFFEFTEDFTQDDAMSKEKTTLTLESLSLLPLEKIASYLDFESLVSQRCIGIQMLQRDMPVLPCIAG